MSDAERWRERRDNYVSLGIHPKVAGALAWQWLDGGPPPESLTDALEGSTNARDAEQAPERRRGQKRS